MISVMAVTIIQFKGSPHIPLIVGTIIAALIAWKYGFTWKKLKVEAVSRNSVSFTSYSNHHHGWIDYWTWIGGGIVATMIYYGLKLMTPSLFLVSICHPCGCDISDWKFSGQRWEQLESLGWELA